VKYAQVYDGEWVPLPRRGQKIVCCDCGLIHRIDVRVKAGKVQFRAFRDVRATAARRRGQALRRSIARLRATARGKDKT